MLLSEPLAKHFRIVLADAGLDLSYFDIHRICHELTVEIKCY